MKHLQKQTMHPGPLLFVLALVLAAFAARADQLTAVRTYDTSAVTLGTRTAPDGTLFQTVDWNGIHPGAEVGSPELPVEHFRFLVPVYSGNFRATVVSATAPSSLPLAGRVMPAQVPQKADGSPAPGFTYPDAEAYARVYSPEAWVVDDGFIDGCNHIVTVAVRPVSYDDATLTASAYGNVVVRLDYDLCGADGLTGSAPIFPPYASRYVNVGDLVVNAADVAQFAPRRAPKATDGDYGKNYYIIVPEDLEDAVEDLRIWKRQKGYNVIVKTIEDICATPRYAVGGTCTYGNGMTEQLVDSAASLRAYLHDEFDANGAYFCLLVGNSKTSMPIRKACRSESGFVSAQLNNGYYVLPTDAYFSDLNQVWNLKKAFEGSIYTTGYWNLSYNPDIYVGRLLCSKADEIANYAEKLILYEANPGRGKSDYLENCLFFEADGMIPESDIVIPHLESLFPNSVIKLIDNGENTYPTGNLVISEMGKAGFSSWHAHGNPFGVECSGNGKYAVHSKYITSVNDVCDQHTIQEGRPVTPGWFSDEDRNGLDNLNNRDYPSVAYSMSCDNTPFDIAFLNGHTYDQTYNLGESFTVGKDYGGPAFLGNTRSGIIGYSDELENEFLKIASSHRKIGISEALSKYLYKGSMSGFLSNSHNLIGEPEFEMWLGRPQKFENLQISDFGLKLSGDELPGAKVALYYGNGGSTWKECDSNSIELHKPMFCNDYAVSVWKTGYLPVITLYSLEGTLTGENKKYIVQNATLGNPLYANPTQGIYQETKIGNGTVYTVNASESITALRNFIIEEGAEVVLDCEKTVELSCTVKDGGKLTVRANKVNMASGFKVEKGGVFNMEMK